MTGLVGPIESWSAIAGCILALVVDLIYVLMLSAQGAGDGSFRPTFVAAYIGLLAVAAGAGALMHSRWVRAALLTGAAAGLGLLGLLSIFSIGLGLLLAGTLVTASALRTVRSSGRSRVAFASVCAGLTVMVGVLGAGLYATDLPVACPSANAQGGGNSMFHGSYSFTCHNGRMNISK